MLCRSHALPALGKHPNSPRVDYIQFQSNASVMIRLVPSGSLLHRLATRPILESKQMVSVPYFCGALISLKMQHIPRHGSNHQHVCQRYGIYREATTFLQ